MIFRLRLKIILTVMVALLTVFVIVLGTINLYMNFDSTRQTDMFLRFVSEMGSMFSNPSEDTHSPPSGFPPLSMWEDAATEAPMYMQRGSFFIARVSEDGEILSVNIDRMYDYTEEEARARIAEVLERGNANGSIDTLQYLVQPTEDGSIIAIAEKSASSHLLRQLLNVSIYVALGSSVVLFLISIFISKWVVRPVQVTFDKQRAFISDASHELKTPLTILSANADMLKTEIGPNKWIDGITAQSARMKALVDDLLALARYDEQARTTIKTSFDLSELVSNTVLEFESLIYEEGKAVEEDIAENIQYAGDPTAIKQAVAILMDNAIKHSAKGAAIRVVLRQEHGNVRIGVFNSGSEIPPEEQKKVFERFYRSDASRSRETGGVGLGLAIAKSIAEMHGGKITIESQENEGVWMNLVL